MIFNKKFGGLPWEYFFHSKEKPEFINGDDFLVCTLCRNSDRELTKDGRVQEGDDIYLLIDGDKTRYRVEVKDNDKLVVPVSTLLEYFDNFEWELSKEYENYSGEEATRQFLKETYGHFQNPFNPMSLNKYYSFLNSRWYINRYPFSDYQLFRWVKNKLYTLNYRYNEHVSYDEEGNESVSTLNLEYIPNDFFLTIQNYLTDCYYNLVDDAPSDKIFSDKRKAVETFQKMMFKRDERWMYIGMEKRWKKNPPVAPGSLRKRIRENNIHDMTIEEKTLEQLSFFSTKNDVNDVVCLIREENHYNLNGFTPQEFKAMYSKAYDDNLLEHKTDVYLFGKNFREYIYQSDGTQYNESVWTKGTKPFEKWSQKKQRVSPKWLRSEE